MKKLLCKLGLHKWNGTVPYIRGCKRCHKFQISYIGNIDGLSGIYKDGEKQSPTK